MKTQKIILAAALLALGAASCQKEKEAITHFTAGREQSEAKTYLGDDNYFYWENTDEVKVYSNSANAGADFTVTPRSDNATWADLTGYITDGSRYTAIYPASIAASATSVSLPAVQTSAAGSLAGFPMYAESSTDEFQFKNLCGALKIHLQQTGCTISRIEVTAGSPISGTYAVSVTEGTPSLAYSANGANSVTLTLGTAQPIDAGHDFYIYLPAGEYSDMQLTFYQPNGASCTKSGSVTVERSVCTPVTINGGLTFGLASNQIWYTTTDNNAIDAFNTATNFCTSGALVSNAWDNDKNCFVATYTTNVTMIPEGCLQNAATLKSVTFPEGPTEVGYRAFDCDQSLSSVTLPFSVVLINGGVFNYCSALHTLDIPNPNAQIVSDGINSPFTFSELETLILHGHTPFNYLGTIEISEHLLEELMAEEPDFNAAMNSFMAGRWNPFSYANNTPVHVYVPDATYCRNLIYQTIEVETRNVEYTYDYKPWKLLEDRNVIVLHSLSELE